MGILLNHPFQKSSSIVLLASVALFWHLSRVAENSDLTASRRGPGKPFPKGVSGNPGGRPKGVGKWRDLLERFLYSPHPKAEELSRQLGLTGENVAETRMDVLLLRMEKENPEWLLEQMVGKAVITQDIIGMSGDSVTIIEHSHIYQPPPDAPDADEKALPPERAS